MHQGSQEKERVAFDPTGNSPGTNQGETLEPRPLRDAAAQTKLGIPEAGSLDPPPPRRTTTYTKTPKSRARTPISMASSRMVQPE